MSAEQSKEWWEDIFDQRYLDAYVDMFPAPRTEREVDFIMEKTGIKGNCRTTVLDICCGHGRHAIALAKRGAFVTGIDTSQYFLDKMRETAEGEKVHIRFFREDLRKLVMTEVCEVALNLFTSFGYFEEEADHVLAMRKIIQTIQRKGRFLIDVKSPISALIKMIEKGKYDESTGKYYFQTVETLSTGLEIKTEEQYNPARMRWSAQSKWQKNGKPQEIGYSVRLFTRPELCSLLEQNGMTVKSTWGDFDGSPYTATSKRLIVLAEKK